MLLGKRPRPPMKRTTSLSEISFDLGDSSAAHQQTNPTGTRTKHQGPGSGAGGVGVDQRFLPSMVSLSPRNNNLHSRHSADFLQTPHFLKSCGLCKRRLVPGRDIYMYRGDSAFCSTECRQQQMNQDDIKDKCSYASSKKQAAVASAAGSQVSAKGETVAAAVAV